MTVDAIIITLVPPIPHLPSTGLVHFPKKIVLEIGRLVAVYVTSLPSSIFELSPQINFYQGSASGPPHYFKLASNITKQFFKRFPRYVTIKSCSGYKRRLTNYLIDSNISGY
jgi:hypothetical protein